MIFTESKRNVLIGVLTGILVGFVLGIFFGNPDAAFKAGKGNAAGNISRIANMGKFRTAPCSEAEKTECDTLRYEAVGADGKSMEIIMIK